MGIVIAQDGEAIAWPGSTPVSSSLTSTPAGARRIRYASRWERPSAPMITIGGGGHGSGAEPVSAATRSL